MSSALGQRKALFTRQEMYPSLQAKALIWLSQCLHTEMLQVSLNSDTSPSLHSSMIIHHLPLRLWLVKIA